MRADPNCPKLDKRAIVIAALVILLLITIAWVFHSGVVTNYTRPDQRFEPQHQKS